MEKRFLLPTSPKPGSNSLRDRVYRKLRMSILTGRISPGTRLVESALATKMCTSRTPVREALHKLEMEALLYSIPKVGYLVNDLSEYDIEDLFATRAAIEQLAARWALGNMTQEELERVKKNLEETDRVLKSGLTKKMITLDTEFHDIICKASRSKRLYQMSQILREHMLRLRMAWLHLFEVAKRARDDHYEIYRAIKSTDPEKLDAAVLAHMTETKRVILDCRKKARENLR